MPRSSADIGLFLLLCVIAMTLITPGFANGSLFVPKAGVVADADPVKSDAPPPSSSLFRHASTGLFAAASTRNSPNAPTTAPMDPTDLTPIALQPIALRSPGISSGRRAAAPRRNTDLAAFGSGQVRRSQPSQPPGPNASQILRLRYLIQTAESRRDGYDAVQHGAKIKPPKRPTRMTIGQIAKWVRDTPKQPHAIGRYQFIPKTLDRLVRQLRLPPNTRFSPQVQDRLADILLAEAGLTQMQAGEISRKSFMRNLAKIWAGFPLPNGRSYYHGYAGNKASMSWATFEREMARIFPS